ncbi:hypothetical protein BN439_3787 [Erwinia amylovora Ea644]|nr:hypothetical protein BN439_3787 [Erwinia amylovora Ea644]CCP08881.1 hypothetical protein BN440_3896 [Erwinia amylovora MR1]
MSAILRQPFSLMMFFAYGRIRAGAEKDQNHAKNHLNCNKYLKIYF